MLTCAIVVEVFSNSDHKQLYVQPPVIGEWASLETLHTEMIERYGSQASYHYRDIGAALAVPVGWIFNQPVERDMLETWISVLDPETLKYLDIGALGV